MGHTRFPIVLLQPDSDISPLAYNAFLNARLDIIHESIFANKRIIAILLKNFQRHVEEL